MTHVYHQTKFRWTENLTCRFIQLRKENGKLFTGRKYSAQAGWEFILRQMREEFPTIMADVHYRVLKKKWSNLLQQYKELKNPVHGDRNKADDVSWPFYNAIDEVLGHGQRSNDDDDDEEEIVDPHEFLCVSVTLEEGNHPGAGSETDDESKDAVRSELMTTLQRTRLTTSENRNRSGSDSATIPPSIADLRKRIGKVETKKRNTIDTASRLACATTTAQLSSIEPSSRSTSISVKDLSKLRTNSVACNEPAHNGHLSTPYVDVDDDRPVKKARRTRTRPTDHQEVHECVLERRLTEFLDYAKQRDEENRSIMTSILQAVEKIANKF